MRKAREVFSVGQEVRTFDGHNGVIERFDDDNPYNVFVGIGNDKVVLYNTREVR